MNKSLKLKNFLTTNSKVFAIFLCAAKDLKLLRNDVSVSNLWFFNSWQKLTTSFNLGISPGDKNGSSISPINSFKYVTESIVLSLTKAKKFSLLWIAFNILL